MYDAWKRVFAARGRARHAGERCTLPEHAKTLEVTVATEGEPSYRGAVAQKIASGMAEDSSMNPRDEGQPRGCADSIHPVAQMMKLAFRTGRDQGRSMPEPMKDSSRNLCLLASVCVFAGATHLAQDKSVPIPPPGQNRALAQSSSFMADGKPFVAGPTVQLFDGKSTQGWKAFVPDLAKESKDPMSVWIVRDGVLVCTGRPIGYIETEALYTNFVIELDWRFDPSKGEGNSGVLLRVTGEDKVWPRSMEAQLHSRNAGDIWNIGEFPAETTKSRTEGRHTTKAHECNEKPLGEWNHYRIVFNKGVLELWVNGVLQNVATKCEVVAGRIGLQSEGAHIEFRNIALTPILD